MKKKMKLVMVGNGMAGVRTLEELLKIAPDLYDITVFGAEPHPNYNRILLSPVLSGEQTLDQIMLNDRDWYAAYGITLHLGKEAARRQIGGIAYAYMAEATATTAPPKLQDFANEHGTPAQRYYNVLCIAYGADPGYFGQFVERAICRRSAPRAARAAGPPPQPIVT